MIDVLLQAKKYKETDTLTPKKLKETFDNYDKVVSSGIDKEPPTLEEKIKKRGRKKRSKSLRLLETFRDRQEQILKFTLNSLVPFDNNLAERDLRMVKLKQKISGCFRKHHGAEVFCRIRSYISTSRKHGYCVLDSLAVAIRGNPINFQVDC